MQNGSYIFVQNFDAGFEALNDDHFDKCAADESNERYDECTILTSKAAPTANDDDAAPGVGKISALNQITIVEAAAGIR